MKLTLVVDGEVTVHGLHTDTVAFSPPVLIKCSICSDHQTLTRTPYFIINFILFFTRHISSFPNFFFRSCALQLGGGILVATTHKM